MRNILNICFDILAFVIGVTTLTLLFVNPESEFLNHLIIAGALLCGAYIVRVICLLVRMPKFDWHLLHGHFLYKVVCFVLLMPCLMTSLIKCDKGSLQCAKEFISEDDLYPGSTKEQCKHCLEDRQVAPPLLWSVYLHFMDPGNQHMTSTKNSRGWAGVIAILGVFLLNGLLVSSIIGWVDRRKEKWQKGEVRYKWFLRFRSHYTIIGGNDMVMGVVKQIFDKIDSENTLIKPYILIQTSRDIESFRRNLFSTLTEEQQQRVVIYYGNRNSEEDIKELGLCNTKEVYILGEDVRTDDIESYHDTINMECLELLRKLYEQTPNGKKITAKIDQVSKYKTELSKKDCDVAALRNDANNKNLDEWWGKRPRLNCRVMFEYQTSFSVFQFFDINEHMDTYIKFTPFNYYELWAQNVFINKSIDKEEAERNFQNGKYLPLEGSDGIKADDVKYVHLFIVGMSRMGVAMAIEAAHLSHYPNFEKKKIRTKITLIDKNAAEEKEFFMGRFKELFAISRWRYGDAYGSMGIEWQMPHIPCGYEYLGGDFLDIEWEFINGGIECAPVQKYILSSANPNAKITIAICLPESNRAHAAALFLDKKIYESTSVLQVLTYNKYGDSIINAISKSSSGYPFCGKLRSFGSAEDCVVCKHLELSETIGGFIDDAYAGGKPQYAINAENSYTGKSNTANRWSSIYNGNTLWTKLRCVDFDKEACAIAKTDIDILADLEHNRWNVEELLMNIRYLNEEEQRDVQSGRTTKKDLKKKMAHLDICSNSRLREIDKGAHQYDVDLTECLVNIYADLKKTLRK